MTTRTTRFAPSPTGYLHLGHAFAAVTAARAGGRFLLRIEDIDAERCREHFADAIFEDLRWLGLRWETPVLRQSQNMHAYIAARRRIKDLTYPCFCTRADIRAAAAAPHADGVVYPGVCRDLSAAERERRIADGEPYAERLNIAAAVERTGALTWHDAERGAVRARPERFGDVVLARKGLATSYHLAATADDHAQGVTLVTRGDDLAGATDIHRLLQALLDYPPPAYHHHRLITVGGRRLAKRDRDLTIRALREGGRSAGEVVAMAAAAAAAASSSSPSLP